MYLNEALTKLKNLKSKAARIDTYINASAVFYEDTTPEYVYADELVNRATLLKDILDLKTRIQTTNVMTLTYYKGNQHTLAELILINASLRAEMGFYTNQGNHSTAADRWNKRTKDDIKQVLAPGCDKVAFRKKIESLELDKEELEGILAKANASTQLV
jgi:hypothetical protein